MKKILLLLVVLGILACKTDKNPETPAQDEPQNSHQDPTHNFTVERLIIQNDKNEILMVKEGIWATPSLVFDERQYVKESLDSLAAEFGVRIKDIELRGYFSYKYDYHPYATKRAYYTARYVDGNLKSPSGVEDVQWMSIEEAIEKTPVMAMKEIKNQVLAHPNTVWGGSFLVSRKDGDHPTKLVEGFYPLFQRSIEE